MIPEFKKMHYPETKGVESAHSDLQE